MLLKSPKLLKLSFFLQFRSLMAWISSGQTNEELAKNLESIIPANDSIFRLTNICFVFHSCELSSLVKLNLFTENGVIKSKRTFDAMVSIDRAFYSKNHPYQDSPQPIGFSATISAPHMVIYFSTFSCLN